MKQAILLFLLVAILALVVPSDALFGLGRKKKDKEKAEAAEEIKPAEAVGMGMEAIMKQMSDPETLKQTMEMLQDPGERIILTRFSTKM